MTSGWAAAPRSGERVESREPWPVADVLVPALILGAMVFNPQLGPLTPLIILASLGVWGWLRWRRLSLLLWPGGLLLGLPLLALASALWSPVPATTLRYASLYLVTVLAGAVIGLGVRRDRALLGLFLALATYTVSSFLWGRVASAGTSYAAFAGLAQSKNAAGDTAALTLLAALAAAGLGLRRGWPALTVGALVLLPVAGWVLLQSRATGSMIAGTAAALSAVLWLLSQRLQRPARLTIFGLVLVAGLAAFLTQSLWVESLFEAVLENSGKDAGLTGRGYIWSRGQASIDAHPWAGIGYNAFWLRGNLDAEGLWRFAGINSRMGFNFHNTPIEILVHLGWIGLGLAALTAVPLAGLLLVRTMNAPDAPAIFFCSLVVYESLRMGFEVVGFGTFHHATTLAFAALAFSLRAEWEALDR